MVLGFLRPADQEGAVAVEPGVAGLDDPAAGTPCRGRSFELELLAAATDVGGVAAAGRELIDPGVAVAAVEAEALRMLGDGSGRGIGIESSVGARSFESWRLAPSCATPIGTPRASQRSERFAPF